MAKDNQPFGENSKTSRGFPIVRFKDQYQEACSLQVSSACPTEDDDGKVADPLGWLWLGLDDAKPMVMKKDAHLVGLELAPGEEVSGWMPYPIPQEVLLHTRMHLNEAQVRGLVQRLQYWLKHGKLYP